MQIDSYLTGFLLCLTSTVLSVIGLHVFRSVLHSRNLIESHDVAGYLFSAVGTMYAIILGLVVVQSMSSFEESRQSTERESNALADIVLLSRQMPAAHRDVLVKKATAYADLVIGEEWPVIEYGLESPATTAAAIDLVNTVNGFEPETERQKIIYEMQVNAATEVWNGRRIRIATAVHGIPFLEWFVLVLGGIITVGFTYFFRIQYMWVQSVMTALVSTMISLNLFLVLMFGYPYSGQIKVHSDTFRFTHSIAAAKK